MLLSVSRFDRSILDGGLVDWKKVRDSYTRHLYQQYFRDAQEARNLRLQRNASSMTIALKGASRIWWWKTLEPLGKLPEACCGLLISRVGRTQGSTWAPLCTPHGGVIARVIDQSPDSFLEKRFQG